MGSFWHFPHKWNGIFYTVAGLILTACAGSTPKSGDSILEMPFIDKLSLWNAPSQIKGANIWQRRVIKGVTPSYSLASFQRLRKLGARYVQLSVPGILQTHPPFEEDLIALQNLDNLIDAAAKSDLKVVIAFRTGPGRPEEMFSGADVRAEHSLWHTPEYGKAWEKMWKIAAEHYAARAHVIGLELMVEPNPPPNSAVWPSLIPRLTAAIRGVDARIPILISPEEFAAIDQAEKLPPLPPGSVLSVHFYEPYGYTHQQSDQKPFSRAQIEARLARAQAIAQRHGAPLAITEYGIKRWVKGAPKYFEDMVASFETKGLPHAVWLWETDEKINYDEFNFRFGPNPKQKTDLWGPQNPYLATLTSAWSGRKTPPAGKP